MQWLFLHRALVLVLSALAPVSGARLGQASTPTTPTTAGGAPRRIAVIRDVHIHISTMVMTTSTSTTTAAATSVCRAVFDHEDVGGGACQHIADLVRVQVSQRRIPADTFMRTYMNGMDRM